MKYICPAIALAFAATIALADDLSWLVAQRNSSTTGQNVTGIEFTPVVDITLTQLGWYDDTFSSADGLSASHAMAVYELATTQVVVSGTVPAGTATTKVNLFRLTPVTPTLLHAGTTYVVAGLANGDPANLFTPGVTMYSDPRITLGAWRSGGASLAFPTFVVPATTRSFGPCIAFTGPAPNVGQPAWTIPPAAESNSNSGLFGTEFTLAAAMDATALGWYDDVFTSGDGLAAFHQVGLYDGVTGLLLATTAVPAGTAAPKMNLFRFAAIPRTRLSSGRLYVVAGLSAGDPGHNVARASVSGAPGVTVGNWRTGVGTLLAFPTQTVSTTVTFTGANLATMPATCTPDFNGDGDAGTDADIEAFFACLAGHCCPACPGADFNGDGDVGTDADIEAFFRVLGGGTC